MAGLGDIMIDLTTDLFSLVAIRCGMYDCRYHSTTSTNCELKHISLDKFGNCKQCEVIMIKEDTTIS